MEIGQPVLNLLLSFKIINSAVTRGVDILLKGW